MIRNFTLSLLFSLFTLIISAQQVYVDNGSTNTYTLYAGDSLSISSGTFRGQIQNWQQGAKIHVAAGADFAPSSFGYFLGEITINGSATLPSLDGQSAQFKLKNFGRLIVTGTLYLGNDAALENNYGSSIEFRNGANLNKVNFTNNGILKTTGNLYIGNQSQGTNNNIIEVSGQLELNSSNLDNFGKVQTADRLVMTAGRYNNNCMTVARAGIFISNTSFNNNGLMLAADSRFVNGGSILLEKGSVLMARDFENNGTIVGSGYFYFTGETRHNGGFIGTNGNSEDEIVVYDETRSNPNSIFDYQANQVRNSVVFQQFPMPRISPTYASCAPAVRAEATLPIRWDFFTVSLTNQLLTLQWGAEQDNGTIFEVERSYDGFNFSAIHSFMAEHGESQFSYHDRDVNSNASAVYYRIRAIEPTGAIKISDIRSVRFRMQGSLMVQASPNPFNNYFTISFKADRMEKVNLRVINLAGQQQFAKTITISNGFNSISVAEAANLSRGLYLVQLTNETGIMATEKLMKK